MTRTLRSASEALKRLGNGACVELPIMIHINASSSGKQKLT